MTSFTSPASKRRPRPSPKPRSKPPRPRPPKPRSGPPRPWPPNPCPNPPTSLSPWPCSCESCAPVLDPLRPAKRRPRPSWFIPKNCVFIVLSLFDTSHDISCRRLDYISRYIFSQGKSALNRISRTLKSGKKAIFAQPLEKRPRFNRLNLSDAGPSPLRALRREPTSSRSPFSGPLPDHQQLAANVQQG